MNTTAAPIDDQSIRVQSASCTTGCVPETGYRLRAYETTYTLERFNNVPPQGTVVVIQNTGDETVNATAWFWSNAGAPVGSSSFTLGPKEVFVLDTEHGRARHLGLDHHCQRRSVRRALGQGRRARPGQRPSAGRHLEAAYPMKRQRRTFNRTAMAWGLVAASVLSVPARLVRAQAPLPETPLLWLQPAAVDALPRSEQAIGADPRSWRALLPAAADLRHVEAFPGVDAVLRGDAARLEVLLTLGPGADPAAVELQLSDATSVETDGHGHAIVRTPGGDVVLLRPGLQQETDEGRRALTGGWRDAGGGRVALVGPVSKESTAVGFRVLFLPEAATGLDRNADGRVTLDELAPLPAACSAGPSSTPPSATRWSSTTTWTRRPTRATP